MAYCTVDDLIIGDLPVSNLVDKQTYVDDAAEEIDAGIGEFYIVPASLYVAPVNVNPTPPPPPFDWRTHVLLKRINAHLATGRLIAMLAIGSEDTSVHAYASSLIKWACDLIYQIKNGQIKLKGIDTIVSGSETDNAPMVSNYDDVSGVDAFTEFAMRPFTPGVPPRSGPWWAPGKVS